MVAETLRRVRWDVLDDLVLVEDELGRGLALAVRKVMSERSEMDVMDPDDAAKLWQILVYHVGVFAADDAADDLPHRPAHDLEFLLDHARLDTLLVTDLAHDVLKFEWGHAHASALRCGGRSIALPSPPHPGRNWWTLCLGAGPVEPQPTPSLPRLVGTDGRWGAYRDHNPVDDPFLPPVSSSLLPQTGTSFPKSLEPPPPTRTSMNLQPTSVPLQGTY